MRIVVTIRHRGFPHARYSTVREYSPNVLHGPPPPCDQVPRRPPFFAVVGGFCGCRGLGCVDFSPTAVDGVPGTGRLREKSGTAVLCFFFMRCSGVDRAPEQILRRHIRIHVR